MLLPPVVFIIFNRPDMTARVFERIAAMRPARLFIAADGPRADHPLDRERVAATRAVVERITWPCEVARRYSDVNLGCGVGPATGITWAFEHVEEAIILEDDCLPDPSFFRYAQELLARYRDDESIMHISGDNWVPGMSPRGQSYFFSRYTFSWGWATWRRAWRLFEQDIASWPELKAAGWLEQRFTDPRAVAYWKATFDSVRNGGAAHIWDIQWLYTCWRHGGLSILPAVNLVSNIGFGADATHTQGANPRLARIRDEAMRFPLQHPASRVPDERRDQAIFEYVFLSAGSAAQQLWRALRDRHRYGALVRHLPWVGKLWADWRSGRELSR